MTQGGLVEVLRKGTDPVAAFAIGSIADNNARIEFNYNPNPYPAKNLNVAYTTTRMLVNTLIHELVHLVKGGGHDFEMHSRVFAGGDTKRVPRGADEFDKFGRSKNGDGTSYAFEASAGFNDALLPACLPTHKEFNKWWLTGGNAE